MRKIGLTAIIFVALWLMCTPIWKEEMIRFQSVQLVNQENDKGAVNQKQPTENQLSQVVEAPKLREVFQNFAENKANLASKIGQIAIPSIDLQLAVLEGTTQNHLMVGATTMQPDQVMGEGNYSLAGHHMRSEHALFSPLMKIKKGAAVYLTDGTTNYYYQVSRTMLVNEKEVSVLKDTESPRLTLVTCDKPTATDKRWVVQATLKSKTPMNQQAESHAFFGKKKATAILLIVVFSHLALLVLAVFLMVVIEKIRKRRAR
ncbi:class A sortase [Listeria valentina]|uniref:class A sortase n=1 Tax=Listeria valentina TaxID=2705293 RepID=UPI0014305D96|nr:class A sortase [Listeria valentina]